MAFDNIIWLDRVDSTNDRLKELAAQGAPEGTVVVAAEQTAGRGTAGRSFFSPAGEGLYLSVLLRPKATVEELLTLTGWAAVAVRGAVEKACGAPCQIKWLNDIYLNGKKLCGILAELSPTLDYVVLGVGINLVQSAETFARQGLAEIATSLSAEGYAVEPAVLEACVLSELEAMARAFPRERAAYPEQYRRHCLTLGQRVRFWQDGNPVEGTAVGVEENFALTVESKGTLYCVTSGTVQRMEE